MAQQMDEMKLHGMRVAILATDGFERSELVEPKRALEEAGAETAVVAPNGGRIQGMNHADKADTCPVDLELKKADPDDFDAVMLPGGALNADHLRMVPEAQSFVRRMDQADKPIAVICHGPWLLVSAGLATDRRITSYPTIQDDLRNAGAKWQDAEVVLDRNWVSSRKPADLPAFNREMVALFAQYRTSRRPAGVA